MKDLPSYSPPEKIKYILEGHGTHNSILAEDESPQDLLARVTETLVSVEKKFGTSEEEIESLAQQFAQHFIDRDFVPGMPTLTNAGRMGYETSALSSCVVVPVDLRKGVSATETILSHYRQNMGSGFNFSRYDDPVAMLKWLNELSARETKSKKYDRRIANMGTLHISHPKIREFINVKVQDRSLTYFNISVEVSEEFMDAATAHGEFMLADGTTVDAYALLQEIAAAASACGDPGLINFDRMNIHNPVASIAPYDCSPPCGEMGLAPGETCQFGYLNLANFVDSDGKIQKEKLAEATKVLVRILDNAVEYGLDHQPTPEGQAMCKLKRKIGISVAGLADALIKAKLPYDSEAGRQLAKDFVSLINYFAKQSSIELAYVRGSCDAMNFPLNNRYYDGYVAERFASIPSNTVTSAQWLELDGKIKNTGMLRNIHHTALPPGGRASMILGVNHSIEPIFSPSNLSLDTTELILELLADSLDDTAGEVDIQTVFNTAIEHGTFQHAPISAQAKELLKTAIEVKPEDHVYMAATLAGMSGVSDESASKTVNLPASATVDDVLSIYLLAHQVGLKNISIYRDQSLDNQPRTLS